MTEEELEQWAARWSHPEFSATFKDHDNLYRVMAELVKRGFDD